MSKIRTYYGYNKNYKPKNHEEHSTNLQENSIPLPSPSLLVEYEELSEGAATKIIDMIKSEQTHRHKLENANLRIHSFCKYLNLVIQLLILFTVILSAVYFSHHDQNIAITVIISGFMLLIFNNMKNLLKHRNNNEKYKFKEKFKKKI